MPQRSAPKTVVLLVLQWERVGGLEGVTRDVAWAFTSLGWHVKVVSVFDRVEPPPSSGFEVTTLNPRGRLLRSLWRRVLWKPVVAWHLRRALAEGGLLVCAHAHLLPALPAVARRGAVRRWGWVFGLEVWGAQAHRWAPLLNGLDRVVAISRFTAGEVLGAGVTSPLSVIPCCVDVSVFTPTPTPERIRRNEVLICGRMLSRRRSKGHDVLFESVAIAERLLGRRVCIRVVGTGDDVARLREVARVLGIGDRVLFTGRASLPELVEAFRHCGVFCMPSPLDKAEDGSWTGEGLGIVYLEAAACGRPAIASAEGGAPEALADGRTGLLVDPRSAEAVGRAIASVLADPGRADEMGRQGRLLAEGRFSRERFLRSIEELIARDDAGGRAP